MNETRLKRGATLCCILCLVLSQSCAEEQPVVPPPSAEYVVTINGLGEPDNVLLEQFFKQKEHADDIKVMVIDKKSKAPKWITPAALLTQNPNAAPYLIFKHDDPRRPFDDLPQ